MVARDVDELGALAAFAQDLLDDVIVPLRPIARAAQAPDVDDVAHEVERFHLGLAQKPEHAFGVAAVRAQVEIGNPGGAIPVRSHLLARVDETPAGRKGWSVTGSSPSTERKERQRVTAVCPWDWDCDCDCEPLPPDCVCDWDCDCAGSAAGMISQ